MSYMFLPLSVIEAHVPRMRDLGVSEVARSKSGFLGAYRRAGGKPEKLSEYWRRRRDGFIKRHMAQVKKRGEALWQDGEPTRRHLALIAWAYSPDAARLRRGKNGMSMHMRANPPWADKALKETWGAITIAARQHYLPLPLEIGAWVFEELGCGSYGCVMPTNRDSIVFKLTTDPTEAEFIQLAEPLGWPSGIVRYHAIIPLDFEHKGREVFAIWREAASHIGEFLTTINVRDDQEYKEISQFELRLIQFRDHAAQFRELFQTSDSPSKHWAEAKKLMPWARDVVSIRDAEGERVDGRFFYRDYVFLDSLNGSYRLAALHRACELIAKAMQREKHGGAIGKTLLFYMMHGFLLADVHKGNVGQVSRANEGATWAITDPGHVVVLG